MAVDLKQLLVVRITKLKRMTRNTYTTRAEHGTGRVKHTSRFVFISLQFFSIFSSSQDYAVKAQIIWINYHLSSEDQSKQNDWQETHTADTGGRVERAVHKVRRLRQETGKAVAGQVKEKVPDTSFLIGSSLLSIRLNWQQSTFHTLKCSTK